ncbi:MAG: DNA internalization-related competence protein ComEC/Rec2 [Christensenellales bacterium]|jgi:competence protein ComEC
MHTPPDPAARFLRIRPLCLLGIFSVVGCAAGAYSAVPPFVWGICLCCFALLFALKREILFCMIAVLFSFACVTASSLPRGDLPTHADAKIRGVVTGEVLDKGDKRTIELRNCTINGEKWASGLRVTLYDTTEDIFAGDTVSFSGYTYVPSGATNPGGFDYALFLARRGISLCAVCKGDLAVRKGFAWDTLPMRLKKAAQKRIDTLFGDDAPLVRGLLLSDKSDMDEDAYAAYRGAGLAHVLAVSGLHISCLALALEYLLRNIFGVGRKVSLSILTGLLLVYGAMIGFPASVLRATAMYLAISAAPLSGRPSDTLTNISFAALLLLALRPLSVTDAGFQLSFLSVLGIVTGMEWFRGARNKVLSLFLTGLFASLGTLPVAATNYGSISLLAPITGILAIPLVTIALPLCAAVTLFPFLKVLVYLAKGLLFLLNAIAYLSSALPFASVRMPAWTGYGIILYYALAFMLLPHFDIRRGLRTLALCGMALCAALSYPLARIAIPSGLALDVLDAGQADSIVLHADGATYLVDVGLPSSPADEYLRHTGLAPKAIFLTHPDDDHAGGLAQALSVAPVETIYLPCAWEKVPHNEALDEALAGQNVVYLKRGDIVPLSDGIAAEVLYPTEGETYATPNEMSLVLLVRSEGGSALLTGDASPQKAPALPDADVLKVSHHGSQYDTTRLTALQVTPSVSVVSVGRNSYGHPSPSVLETLAVSGSAVYTTELSGMVRVHIEPTGEIAVYPYKGGDTHWTGKRFTAK